MEQLAQIIVLLLIAALAIATIQGGPAGARNWWRAKFLGKTPGQA